MAFVVMNNRDTSGSEEKMFQRQKTVMIFTEGTVLGPKRWWDWPFDRKYIPVGNSVAKIRNWEQQGANIFYLTSRRKVLDVEKIKEILITNGFPGTRLYYREGKEKYKDIAEAIVPAALVEDDCRSIGGKCQMTITHVQTDIRKCINSIVVKEFDGIDSLPDRLSDLLGLGKN